jgi:hypothetical protein
MDDIIRGCAGRSVQRQKIHASGWTKARRQIFLDTLAATCNVRRSVAAVGMTARGAYLLRRRDPGFDALWKDAMAIGYQRLEEALLQRALESINDIEINADDAANAVIVPGSGFSKGPLTSAEVQLILSLVNRHRATVEGRGKPGNSRRYATPEEVDARLTAKLDSLAKRLKASE